MTYVTLTPKTNRITVRTTLRPSAAYAHRDFAVSIQPVHAGLTFTVWGRTEPGRAKFRPCTELGDDFLSRVEEVVVGAGLDELSKLALGRTQDDATVKRIIDVVRDLLECTAAPEQKLADAA